MERLRKASMAMLAVAVTGFISLAWIGFIMVTRSESPNPAMPVVVCLTLFMLASVIVFSVNAYTGRGKALSLVVAALFLPVFPVGTLVAIYFMHVSRQTGIMEKKKPAERASEFDGSLLLRAMGQTGLLSNSWNIQKILIMRGIATLFLVVSTVTLTVTPAGVTWSAGILRGAVKIGIAGTSDNVYLSSVLLGSILGLAATVQSIRLVGDIGKFQWPLIWSTLTIVSLTNEITRLFHNHPQVLLSFPLFQTIADWLSIRFLRSMQAEPDDTHDERAVQSPPK